MSDSISQRVSFTFGVSTSRLRLLHFARTLRGPSGRRAAVVLLVMCGVCIGISTWLPADPGFRMIAVGFPLALVGMALVLAALSLLIPRSVVPREVAFCDEGMVSTRRGVTKLYPWSSMKEVNDGPLAIDMVAHFEGLARMVVDKRLVAPEIVATLSFLLRRHCPNRHKVLW